MNEQEAVTKTDAEASSETSHSASADERPAASSESGGSDAATAASQEELEARLYALLVGVRMSIRYHDVREAWFLRWHRMTQFFTVIFAGGVAARLDQRFGDTTFGDNLVWVMTVLLGAAVVANLVFKFESRANDHRGFANRFRVLEKSLGPGWDHGLTLEDYKRLYQERLDIETDEVTPTMTLLSMMCQLQVLISSRPDLRNEIKDMMGRIPKFRRVLAHWRPQSQFVLQNLDQVRPSN